MRDFPAADADDFEWLLFEQAGVITTQQAFGFLGRAAVRTNLAQQRWRRICQGVLLSENGRLWRDQQLWVAVLAAGDGARLSGASAATLSGVRGIRLEPIDVLVPASRNRTGRLAGLPSDMPEVRVHRTTILPAGHQRRSRPPCTTVARAVVDGASWASSDHEARVIVMNACQQRHVKPSSLRRVLADMPRVRRRQLIRTTVADIEGGAESLSEVDLVSLCRRFRLPRPVQQVARIDADGRRRFLDAYWPEARLHVEVDGAHHVAFGQWAADMHRQNQVWVRGDRILRFPAYVVRSKPAEVAAQLRAALSPASEQRML
jgi:very-short-patch-repair endonuclease